MPIYFQWMSNITRWQDNQTFRKLFPSDSVNCCIKMMKMNIKNHFLLGTPVDRERWLISRHLRAAVNSSTVTSSPHGISSAETILFSGSDGVWFCISTIPNSSSTMLCGKTVEKRRPVLALVPLLLLLSETDDDVDGRFFIWCRRWRRALSIILPTIASLWRNERFASLNGSVERDGCVHENWMLKLNCR